MSQKGRAPLAMYKKEVQETCKDTRTIKAARYALAAVDVLVCGTCQQAFHLIHEFHEHKKKANCSQPKQHAIPRTTEVWAFTLWKSSSRTKNLFPDSSSDAAMWRNWKQLNSGKQQTWLAAGRVFYEFAALQSSDTEFDSAKFDEMLEQSEKPMVKPVPLDSLLKDPKLNSGATVSLERVFVLGTPTESAASVKTRTTNKRSLAATDTPVSTKRAVVEASPDEQESGSESQEFVVEAIVGKRLDKETLTFQYEIKWEGFPSSQNTWEPEANLTHCKDMIAEFERRRGTTISASGKPVRSSKAKAIDRVKFWVGSKDTSDAEQSELKSVVEIKEEQTSLDMDYGGDNDDSYSPSEDEQVTKKKPSPTKTPAKTVILTKTREPIVTKTVATKVIAKTPAKVDPKTSTLLLANALGMVRVNAKALPGVKPGIYPIEGNEQLQRIKPLVPKGTPPKKSGLVVFTSDPAIERPGVRRKPLLPVGNMLPSLNQPSGQQSTTIVVPPAPVSTPYLVMAPPGSGIGALLITPTEKSTPTTKTVTTPKTVASSKPIVSSKTNANIVKTTVSQTTTETTISKTNIVQTAFAEALKDTLVAEKGVESSKDDDDASQDISLAMEVTEHDSDEELNEEPQKSSKVGLANEGNKDDSMSESEAIDKEKENREKDEIEKLLEKQFADIDEAITKPSDEAAGDSTEEPKIDETVDKPTLESDSKLVEALLTGEEKQVNLESTKKPTNVEGTEDESIDANKTNIDSEKAGDKIIKEKPTDVVLKELTEETIKEKPTNIDMNEDKIDTETEVTSVLSVIEADKTHEPTAAISPEQLEAIEKALDIGISSDFDEENDESTKDESDKQSKSEVEKKIEEKPSSPTKKPKLSPTKSGASPADIVHHDFVLSGPQLVSIPEGVDPSLIQLPPDTQLMVSDSGEYYLVPVQPEGSNLAIAQDPETGAVQMVSLEENSQSEDESRTENEDKFLVVMPDGQYLLMSDQAAANNSAK